MREQYLFKVPSTTSEFAEVCSLCNYLSSLSNLRCSTHGPVRSFTLHALAYLAPLFILKKSRLTAKGVAESPATCFAESQATAFCEG